MSYRSLRSWLLPGVLLVPMGLATAADSKPPAMVAEDLARGKLATASDSQGGHAPDGANDGDPQTRWCAEDGSPGHWWRVDLGRPDDLTGCRVLWEADAGYGYTIEGSADGVTWKTLVDATRGDMRDRERLHAFRASGIRYVRVNVTGLEPGHWASFFECAVLGTRQVAAAAGSGPGSGPRPEPKGAGEEWLLAGVKVPPGFTATLFAAPPEVHYPTCLTAAPTGEVFIGIDENGSLDAKGGRGRVVRCLDDDGDGKADRINVFAEMDSPRGLEYDAGTLYVLHPPDLTAYHDDDRDGKADRSETLIKGIGFDLSFRGADHTTNGIRLGIDGWIYVAVGDYGFIKAIGKDGTERQLRGGGIARVRTDGSGLEVYNRGQRNIYDVAIDPYMNLFTRDNTNDGGGWDVRLSYIVPTGHYGYPLLFAHFGEEIVPPLADYGGGSPTGSLYIQEPSLPGFNDTLYTCDWGRSVVYKHPLTPSGAGFKAGQEPFVEMSRPTDMDIDGLGRIYIASWREGKFTYSGPDVGDVVRVTYPGITPPPFPDLDKASDAQLLGYLAAPGATLRLHAQRAILRRGEKPSFTRGLEAMAEDGRASLAARVAALFTLEQLLGRRSHGPLVRLAKDDTLREFALRALADRTGEAADVSSGPFVAALGDPNPRVRLQAAAGLGRLGKSEASTALLPLTADPDPLVAHVAVRALVSLKAVDACLRAIEPSATPAVAIGAARVLQSLHEPEAVDGLIGKLGEVRDPQVRRGVLRALCRLDRREASWDGKWWGTRPDTSGPYFKPEAWEKTEAIRRVLGDELRRADAETLRWLLPELIRNKIDLEEVTTRALKLANDDPGLRATTVELLSGRPDLSPEAVRFLGEVAASDRDTPALRARALRGLQRVGGENRRLAFDASVAALAAADADDQREAELRDAWQEFVRDNRNARNAQALVAMAEATGEGGDPARGILAYAALVQLDGGGRPSAEARHAVERAWGRPETAARLLRAIGRVRADRFEAQVRAHLKDDDAGVRRAAADAARRLGLDRSRAGQGPPIAGLDFDRVVAAVQKEKGDPELGALLFQKQGCVSCHTTSKSEPPKGPFLGDIANRYSRAELTESILKPGARIAQGFETQKFATTAGQVVEGFVVRESGDEVELRNASGAATVIPKADIEERGTSEASIMPTGLADPLTVPELASILAYLEALKGAN